MPLKREIVATNLEELKSQCHLIIEETRYLYLPEPDASNIRAQLDTLTKNAESQLGGHGEITTNTSMLIESKTMTVHVKIGPQAETFTKKLKKAVRSWLES